MGTIPTTETRPFPLAERQAALARFEERVNAAPPPHSPTKEWVRKAIRRGGAPRCPTRLKVLSLDVIIRYGDQIADLYCRYPDDVIHLQPYEFSVGFQSLDRPDRVDALRVLTESAEWTDEWGTRWGHRTGGVGATPLDVPLKDWSRLEEYTPGEVGKIVRQTIETLGTPYGNAYLGSPANLVPPTVPFENPVALIESFHET